MQRTRGSSCVSPFEQRGTAFFGTGCKIITVCLSTPIYPCLLAAATCIRTELDRTTKNLILLLPSSEKLTTLQIILQVDTNLVMLLFRDPAAAADAMETVKVTQSALSHVPTINYQSLPVWDTCRLEQQQNDTKKITFHYEKSSIFHTQVFTCITERKKQLWKSSMYLIPKSSHEQIPSKTKIKYWHEHA